MDTLRKCAVIVGVNKTGGLQPLIAAAEGAEEFAGWARSQNFDVKLITDKSSKVSLSDITNAVAGYVNQMIYDQMIIYFAGHGILKGPDYELWLLSDSPINPNEAVNLLLSVSLSRNSGIPHIIFVSDACRSIPNNYSFMQISGGAIFPNQFHRSPRPEVDIFYASIPGDPAYEASIDKSIKRTGVFTKCLINGLRGNDPRTIRAFANGNINHTIFGAKEDALSDVIKWVIPSSEMKIYLQNNVPQIIMSIDITLQQDPDIRVESRDPKYLSEIDKPIVDAYVKKKYWNEKKKQVKKSFLNFEKDVHYSLGNMLQDIRSQDIVEMTGEDSTLRNFRSNIPGSSESKFIQDVEKIYESKGRQSFETHTGFTIIGSKIERAYVTKSNCDIFEEGGNTHIRVHDMNTPQSILIVLNEGMSLPLAVLNGFIGTVVFDENRVLTVNYTPSRNTYKYHDYIHFSKQVELRRAFVATSARNGFSFTNFVRDGGYLREFKAFDPSLGLYASYSYAQGGKSDDISSIYRYMRQESKALIFDVALLANKLTDDALSISPFCPMLTQGWAYIGPYLEHLNPAIRESSRNLVPGLWTTFNSEGTRILLDAIMNRTLL